MQRTTLRRFATHTALLAMLLPAAHSAHAQVFWIGGNGSWNTGTNWSTSPSKPGPGDDVVNNVGATITHEAGTNSVLSFTTNGLLQLTGGILQIANALNFTSGGSLLMAGGTLQGATINDTSLVRFSVNNNNVFNNVTLGAGSTLNIVNASAAGSLRIGTGGLTFGNGTVFNVGTTATANGSYLAVDGTQTFAPTSGTATVNLGSATVGGNFGYGATIGTLTIGSGVTIQGRGGVGAVGFGGSGSQGIVNNGTIRANIAGQTLTINSGNFTNNGTLSASNGATLSLSAATSLLGTLQADGANSIILLSSPVTTAATDNFSVTNGGTIRLFLATLTGNLTAANASVLSFTSSTFNSVTLGAGTTLNVADNNGTAAGNLRIGTGGLTFGNGTVFNVGTSIATSNSSLVVDGTQTFGPTSGTATINLGSATSSGNFGYGSGTGTLTIGSGITLQGRGNVGFVQSIGTGIVNNGIIQANISGQTLAVSGGTHTNNGILAASNGATLSISNISGNALSTVQADGTNSLITLAGSATTTATDTLSATNGGVIRLNSATLTGTLTAANASALSFSNSVNSVFNALTLGGTTLNIANNNGAAAGSLRIGTGGLTFGSGMTFNVGTTTATTGSSLVVDGTQTFAPTSGTATVNLGSATSSGNFGYGQSAGTLTIGSGVTLQGRGTVGFAPLGAGTGIVNNGTIQANLAGQGLTISGGTLTNNGILAALNGGTLTLASIGGNALGTVQADGTNSVVNLSGTATVTATDTFSITNGGVIRLNGGTLTGTLTAANASALSFANNSNALNALTLGAGTTLNVANNNGTALGGVRIGTSGLTFGSGTVFNVGTTTGSTTSNILVDGTQTFAPTSGTATVNLGSATSTGNFGYGLSAGTLTIGSGVTIQGRGSIGNVVFSGTGIVNNGTVQANISGQTLSLTGGNFTNNGIFAASNGAILSLTTPSASGSTLGTLQADGTNSAVNLVGNATVTAADVFSATNGGVIRLSGGTLTGTLTAANASALVFSNDASNAFNALTFSGTTLNVMNTSGAGTLRVGTGGLTFGSGTVFNVGTTTASGGSSLRVDGTQTFAPTSGTATVNLGSATTSGSFGYGTAPGTLTIGSGVTVQGRGTIGTISASGSGVVNNGTIQSNIAGQTLIVNTIFTNNGTVQANATGSALTFSSSLTNNGTVTASGNNAVVNFNGTPATNTGTLLATAGGRLNYNTGSPALTNSGTIDVDSGSSFTVAAGGITQSAGLTDVDGTMTLTNATLTLNGGVLDGDGIINGTNAVVTNASGTVTAGDLATAGKLSMTGTYNQLSSGVMSVQIGGTGQGTFYDFFDITGTANLNGSLTVDLFDSFLPNVGDQFQVLRATNRNGTFTNTFNGSPGVVAARQGTGGYLFNVVYASNGVTLIAAGEVPQPSSLALLLTALTPFGMLCRRKYRALRRVVEA